MKIKTLAVAAGVSAPLILSGSASGGFVGVTTTAKPNAFGLLTVNVYAEFDRPGEDAFVAVAGIPNAPLFIEVIGGTFFQHPFGDDEPPTGALVNVFPSLAYDTFVTIGVKCVGDPPCQPKDNLTVTPGSFFRSSTLECTTCGWAVTPNNPQGNPFHPDTFPGNGKVLIGQFSTEFGAAIQGTMLLHFVSNGIAGSSFVSFPPPCPWDVEPVGGDGIVGITDFLFLLAQWGTDPGGPPDFDGDGNVGIVDFLELLANWGPCP